MSEPEPTGGAAPDTSQADTGPSTAALAVSVRRIRLWLIVLSLIVSGMVFVGVAVAGLFVMSFRGPESEILPTTRGVDDVREEFKSALGSRLESIAVREVSIDFGSPPFPYSLLRGETGEKMTYVEYRLKGSPVLVAGMLGGPFGGDPSRSGMLPTRGSLASRMTDQQFQRLLSAYAAETKEPLGSVRRYTDRPYMQGGDVPEKVAVGARQYPARELWSAVEGRLVKGDRVTFSDESMFGRDALIFHEDPKTGAFTYLGTEPANGFADGFGG